MNLRPQTGRAGRADKYCPPFIHWVQGDEFPAAGSHGDDAQKVLPAVRRAPGAERAEGEGSDGRPGFLTDQMEKRIA